MVTPQQLLLAGGCRGSFWQDGQVLPVLFLVVLEVQGPKPYSP